MVHVREVEWEKKVKCTIIYREKIAMGAFRRPI